MWRLAGVSIILLAACNQWIRPKPSPEHVRSAHEQRAAAVSIDSYCDPFEDGTLGHERVGTGVMVSDWQVITALHVVDCRSAIPTIWVTDSAGTRFAFAPEREWRYRGDDGVSRIQMRTGDSFRPALAPPVVLEGPTQRDQLLFMQAASPRHEEVIGEATGAEYAGDSYGDTTFTYNIPSESGNSGAAVYDGAGYLVGIHLGSLMDGQLQYGIRLLPGAVPQ